MFATSQDRPIRGAEVPAADVPDLALVDGEDPALRVPQQAAPGTSGPHDLPMLVSDDRRAPVVHRADHVALAPEDRTTGEVEDEAGRPEERHVHSGRLSLRRGYISSLRPR